MSKRNKTRELDSNHLGVGWVRRLLNDAGECPTPQCIEAVRWEVAHNPVDESFLDQCRQAALNARTIRLLREQAERIQFVPLPLGEYVALLCRCAGVSVQSLLGWAGVEDIVSITADTSRGVVQIALALGLGLRELLVYVRLGLIQRDTGLPVGALARPRDADADGSMSVSACESFLESVETSLNDKQQRTIRDIVNELRDAYLHQ